METPIVTFRCPMDLRDMVDAAGKEEHRDRTNMLVKIVAEYFKSHPLKNGSKPAVKKPAVKKAPAKKKAGVQ